MGWRDRDYARWTDEERNRSLGTSTSGHSSHAPRVSGGLAAAVAISAALFALGHFPAGNPLVPALHFNIGGSSTVTPGSAPPIIGAAKPTVRLTGPTAVRVGSFLTFHGPVPTGDEGSVSVLGSLNGGVWRTLAVADGSSGSYLARIALNTRGSLRVRVHFKDGAEAAQTIQVY